MLTLTPARLSVGGASLQPTRYRCESAADGFSDRTVPLGVHLAKTPRLAVRWLRGRARHVADQLDEPCARPVLRWLEDPGEHERALAALVRGGPYSFHVFDDGGVRYVFLAKPAVLAWLPLPDRPLDGEVPWTAG